jgi:type III restriction enzyme
MQLKHFQETAITRLKQSFYQLWKGGKRRANLVFKSPTGSGKTIMMAEFLKRISGDMQFEADKAFLWISFNEESYEQSKKKLYNYYNHGVSNMNLLDLNDLNNGYLKKNEIFFINWQKIVSRAKDNRRLRQSGEQNTSFDDFIAATHAQGRELVLIVDEAHIAKHTELAEEIISLINPRIEMLVSATPKSIPTREDEEDLKGGFVRVKREDVIDEGLIKESIEIMPLEEIEKIERNKGEDLDHLLLDLAIEKKKFLKEKYEEMGLNINPLVLIQIPNDEKGKKEVEEQKLAVIRSYLASKGYLDDSLAVWLSAQKENLEEITQNDSPIDFLIFKQAAATGWDCPRAQVLVMFREIKTPVFRTQVLGRILRMPESKHYPISQLNKAYLYTNYARNQIEVESSKMGENKLALHKSYLREGIENISFPSVFLKRAAYGDLGDSFQKTFKEVANEFFGIDGTEIFDQLEAKLNQKGLETKNISLTNNLIVNSSIECFDDFLEELQASEETLSHTASRHDTEKTYNLLLYREIKIQEEERKKFAPERSWSKLKTALNIWLKGHTFTNPPLYAVVSYDLQKEDQSVMRKVISKALEVYKPIREKEELIREQKSREELTLSLKESYSFTDDYEEKKTEKCAIEPFYIGKNYDGRKNEEAFIDFLEGSQNVLWWFKNGDYGRDFFAIQYTDKNGKLSLFYPDFLVKTKDGRLGIFDTKGGQTAESSKEKAEALQAYIEEQNKEEKNLWGGIVIQSSGQWLVNENEQYEYNPNNLSSWKVLSF